MKIIGCGNPDRADDQAGLLVAQRLRELGLDADIHSGDPLILLNLFHAEDDVILIDTVVTGASVGTVQVWDGELPPSADQGSISTHGFDILSALQLARSLRTFPARLTVFGIEGRQFTVGAPISPEVETAIASTVQQVRRFHSQSQNGN